MMIGGVMSGHDQWWRDAVVYQVYPRSFADADRDGEGDFAGLRQRLPHLVKLGVDALWLTPFYPSPMADGGYDISDYTAIDPRYGSMHDFTALVGDAASHGIRVIVDIVPNHCSVEHPWFQAALKAGPGSPERERFIFREGLPDGRPPNNWQSIMGGPAWTRLEDGQWYLHLFDSSQPDFNWRHLEVPALFEDVLRFWLDRGVAGIRVDVAGGLFKAEGLPDTPEGMFPGDPSAPYVAQPELFDTYRAWRKILDGYGAETFPGPRAAVLEVWYDSKETMRPYLAEGQLHQVFNLSLLSTPWTAADLRRTIASGLAVVGDSQTRAPWVLENHDFPRLATRLGIDQELVRTPTLEVLRGEVDVDPELGNRRARGAALLLLALPGSAYIFQGQELGLNEVLDIPAERRHDPVFTRTAGLVLGRDGCRVPLPWGGDEPPYGFTEAGAGTTWLPQPAGWAGVTVEAQERSADSMLNLYRRALEIRRSLPALGDGTLTWADAGPDVLAFTREPGFAFVLNCGTEPILLPAGEVVLTSAALQDGLLPPDAAAWVTTPR
jgi:alpha-glucosidase